MGELDRASLIRNQAAINTRLDQVSEAIGGHAKQLTAHQKTLDLQEAQVYNIRASLTDHILDSTAEIATLRRELALLQRPWYRRLFSFRARPTEA